jgi:hypothetical protein
MNVFSFCVYISLLFLIYSLENKYFYVRKEKLVLFFYVIKLHKSYGYIIGQIECYLSGAGSLLDAELVGIRGLLANA